MVVRRFGVPTLTGAATVERARAVTDPTRPASGQKPRAEEQVQVRVNVDAIRQPHGKHWVKLELVCGNSVHALLLPPGTASKLGEIVPQALAHGVDAARRADLGLLVAPANGKLPPLP
jgi:hypothetical protein